MRDYKFPSICHQLKHWPHLICFSVIASLFSAGAAYAYTAKVIGVSDGDTIKVQRNNGQQVKIRLYGIDTPEKKQAYGNQAKSLTNKLVRGKTVNVDPIDTDRYGRTVGVVTVNGRNVNESLVFNGLAWVYPQYCRKSFCLSWKSLERAAKAQRRGMWDDPNIVPPWEWRKGKRSGSSAKRVTVVKRYTDSIYSSKKTVESKPVAAGGKYHGNVQSRKFHRPECRHYNCKNCTAGFGSREEAIRAGYAPCWLCKP